MMNKKRSGGSPERFFHKKTRGGREPRGKGLWDKRYELPRSWQDGFATDQLISCKESIPRRGKNVKSEACRKKTTFVARIIFLFPERIEERGHAAQNLQRSRKP